MTRSDSLQRCPKHAHGHPEPAARHLPSSWLDRQQTLLWGAFAAYKTQMKNFSMGPTPQLNPSNGRIVAIAPLPGRLSRWLVVLAAVVSLACLQACSTLKVGYSQGARLTYWWIDGQLDLQDAQAGPTREAVARFFVWHRQDQLPRVAALLRRAQEALQQPVTAQQMYVYQEAFQQFGRAAFDQAKPDIARLLLSTTPAQLAHVQKKLTESNEKYRRRYLGDDAEERLRARLKKVMEDARLIYGSFSAEQEEAIRTAIAPMVDSTPARYEERVARQQAWLALIARVQQERPDEATVVQWLTVYADQWQRAPGERGVQQRVRRESDTAMLVTIANLTTPRQKQHARERLQGWINDVRDLMRDGETGGATQAQNN
ncbi:hypothetical protein LMG18101_04998 [Ralstonia flaminis]|uniref:Lipoprotein n=1 Tax=Ralstonia flaminis TaxID=3058597 RepID=A0ABM9KDE6_9RALS|nr:hypothetical protein LMG18101_04998 [Ralstonia sp. LMG 18101]